MRIAREKKQTLPRTLRRVCCIMVASTPGGHGGTGTAGANEKCKQRSRLREPPVAQVSTFHVYYRKTYTLT